MKRSKVQAILMITMFLLVLMAETAQAARVKDLVNIRGVRNNQLLGFGLVIGLNGTGDSATNVFFSIQTVVNMLKAMGITVPSGQVNQLKFKNIATVMVTADLPAFARQGDRLDVLVSSVGDAKSLQGGTLLMTPLKGADGNTYVVGQGPLSIGGFSVQGQSRGVQKNHLQVGRISNGGSVERELFSAFNKKEIIHLSMKSTDFTTAGRVAKAVNKELKDDLAMAMDGRSIRVRVPEFYRNNATGFVTKIESLQVDPDTAARVIIDERTGTVVMGENVMISTVAVAHGGLFVQIREEPLAVQPAPLAEGDTAILPRTRVAVEEGSDRLIVVPRGVGIGDVTRYCMTGLCCRIGTCVCCLIGE